jgi:uncharacterized protein YecT (DUF1311 family)
MIRKGIIFLLLIFSIFLATTTFAQNTEDDCDNPMTQTAMNMCSKYEADMAMEALKEKIAWSENRLYDKNLTNFRTAQAAWEKYREIQCDAIYESFKTGSISPLMVNSCFNALTTKRLEAINNIYQTLELMVPKDEK